MNRVYLDHSATTKVDKAVLQAMLPYFDDKFGNASSIHSLGQEARVAVDCAREVISNFLNCKTNEVIFTSGGSESDNLAIKGLVSGIGYRVSGISNTKSKTSVAILPHIITSAFEHHAVLDTVKELEKDGIIEATYIKPKTDGIIDPKDVERAIKPSTVLVSIMYVNNEVGTVQPIREIGKIIEKKKNDQKIYFHTDAVQAPEYFNMDTKYLHVDLLTISAHKIYGPKGVGVLFVKRGTPIKRQIVGGGQEYKMRAGTENVVGIVGMGEAVEQIKISNLKSQNYGARIKILRDRLIEGLLKISDSRLNGSQKDRSPNNVNISFKNAEGESILLNLDALGICASSGSACTSGSLEPSHVLQAIGVPAEMSHGSVRFTLGRETTEQEIDRVIEVMPGIIKKLREMSPFAS